MYKRVSKDIILYHFDARKRNNAKRKLFKILQRTETFRISVKESSSLNLLAFKPRLNILR